jgi:Transglutaminase-like superfamily
MQRVLPLRCSERAGVKSLALTTTRFLVIAVLVLSTATILRVLSFRLTFLHVPHHLHVGPHSIRLASLAVLFATIAFVSAYTCYNLVMARYRVYNVADVAILRARHLQNFVQQDRNSGSMLQFRAHLQSLLDADHSHSLSQAIAIRQWVRQQQGQERQMWAPPFVDHDDPFRLLQEQRNGVPGACRRFSFILLAALLSAGFDVRIVCFTSSLYRREGMAHSGVEVWIEELHQWVFLDPTFDTLVLVAGKPASALDLQLALAQNRFHEVSFERHGSCLKPCPNVEVYSRYCVHLFVRLSNAIFDNCSAGILRSGVHFLHYNGGSSYPVRGKYLTMGIGACGLVLSTIFWLSTLFSGMVE